MPANDKPAIFKWLADVLPFGVYILDLHGQVLYWNRGAEHITGYLAQEVLGRACCNDFLVHCAPEDAAVCNRDACALEARTERGTLIESHRLFRHKEGHTIPLVFQALPIRDDDGRMVATAQFFQEQTASRELHSWMTDGAARIDPELGLPTVAVTQDELASSLHEPGTAVLLIEVEHAADMSRHFGTEMVHTVIRTLARTVSHLITVPYFLGRWNRGSLLLIVPNCNEAAVKDLIGSLESAHADSGLRWWGDRVTSHVRVKGTVVQEHESSVMLMERLAPGYNIAGSSARE